MSDDTYNFEEHLEETAAKLLDDPQLCKAMLLNVLKLADQYKELRATMQQVMTCGDTMAQLISLNRAEQAYDLWRSFRAEDEDDADAHS